MAKIYLVMEGRDTEDCVYVPIKGFLKYDKAKECMKEMQEKVDDLFEYYEKLDHKKVKKLFDQAFLMYVRDNDEEYYNSIPQELKDDFDTDTYFDNFDYDRLDCYELGFESDINTVKLYAFKVGLSKEEIKDIETTIQVEDYYFGEKPIYYASGFPIDFETNPLEAIVYRKTYENMEDIIKEFISLFKNEDELLDFFRKNKV